jgi:hypothetical protein
MVRAAGHAAGLMAARRPWVLVLLLAGCAGAPSGAAPARSVVLQWDPVDQRVNGEPLDPAQLSHYQIEQRSCGGPVERLQELAGGATRAEVAVAELSGDCMEFRVRAVAVGGQIGDWSESVRWTRR